MKSDYIAQFFTFESKGKVKLHDEKNCYHAKQLKESVASIVVLAPILVLLFIAGVILSFNDNYEININYSIFIPTFLGCLVSAIFGTFILVDRYIDKSHYSFIESNKQLLKLMKEEGWELTGRNKNETLEESEKFFIRDRVGYFKDYRGITYYFRNFDNIAKKDDKLKAEADLTDEDVLNKMTEKRNKESATLVTNQLKDETVSDEFKRGYEAGALEAFSRSRSRL